MKTILVDIAKRDPHLMVDIFNNIRDGFKLFGKYKFMLRTKNANPRDYDIVVFVYWKLLPDKLNELLEIRKLNIQTLFISDGLFSLENKKKDHNRYPLLMLTGGPPSSNYCNRNYDIKLTNDRLQIFGDELTLSPWKLGGDKIVIAHQRGFSYSLEDKHEFYRNLIIDLNSKGYHTIFRLHPGYSSKKTKSSIKECGAKLCNEISYSDRDMFETDDIYASVSYGGKVSSQYIINGIPSFTKENTMSYPLCGKGIDIGNRVIPPREWWVKWLSYRHWTLDEFSRGLVLKFLKDKREICL